MKFNSPEEQMKYEEMKRQKNEQKEREKKVWTNNDKIQNTTTQERIITRPEKEPKKPSVLILMIGCFCLAIGFFLLGWELAGKFKEKNINNEQ